MKVVGDSNDNAGLSLTANGFKEMQRAVRQGSVNAVIVPTLDGISKTTEVYTSFERELFTDTAEDECEEVLTAKYKLI